MQTQARGDLFCLRQLSATNNVTMAIVLIGYEVVQSVMLIHTTIKKQEQVLPGVINCCHGKYFLYRDGRSSQHMAIHLKNLI